MSLKFKQINNYLGKVIDYLSSIITKNGLKNISEIDKIRIQIIYNKIVRMISNEKLVYFTSSCFKNITKLDELVDTIEHFFLQNKNSKYILSYMNKICSLKKGGKKKNATKTTTKRDKKINKRRNTRRQYKNRNLKGGQENDCPICIDQLNTEPSFTLHRLNDTVSHDYHINCFNDYLLSNHNKKFVNGCIFCISCNTNIDNNESNTGCDSREFIEWWNDNMWSQINPQPPKPQAPQQPQNTYLTMLDIDNNERFFEDNLIAVAFIILHIILFFILYLLLDLFHDVRDSMEERERIKQRFLEILREFRIENEEWIEELFREMHQ